MNDIRVPRIRCAMCCRPVDRIVVDMDVRDYCWTITAFCHGEKDRMSLGFEQLKNDDQIGEQILAQEGIAFAPKMIEALP